MCKREIVLALPDKFDVDKLGSHYFKLQLERMNEALREKYKNSTTLELQLLEMVIAVSCVCV